MFSAVPELHAEVTLRFPSLSEFDSRPRIRLYPKDCLQLLNGGSIEVCVDFNGTKIQLYMSDILGMCVFEINFMLMSDPSSNRILFAVLNTGLVNKVEFRDYSNSYAREVCRIFERISLPVLAIYSHSETPYILRAISQGKLRIKKIEIMSVMSDFVPDIFTMISSPMSSVQDVMIVNVHDVNRITSFIDAALCKTWIYRLIVLSDYHRRDDSDILRAMWSNQRLNRLLHARHQLFLLSCSKKRRKCAMSKLPVDMLRMLFTFLY